MANNVVAQVMGGSKQILDGVSTVQDVKTKLNVPNHTAAVNGDTASADHALEDGDFVSLSQAVKGA